MSENQNRGNIAFGKYDSMATEALEEILRLDAETPEGQESDTDKILYIMEVLAERKRNTSHTGKTALEAYDSFKQNYMPETDTNIVPMKPKHKGGRWLRSLTAAAAVFAILLVGSVAAKAFGFNIWKTVIQWTQETFHFGEWGNSNPDSNLQFDSFEKALEEGNTPSWLIPTYTPDGFNLTDVQVEQSPLKKKYSAIFSNGGQVLRITVRDYLDKSPVFVEQSEGLVEEYEASGTIYYLFSNQGQNRAVWLYESYECDISGDVAIEELKKMIDSIQKG